MITQKLILPALLWHGLTVSAAMAQSSAAAARRARAGVSDFTRQ